jgi:hypothetical protein
MESSDPPSSSLSSAGEIVSVPSEEELAAARASLVEKLSGQKGHKYIRFVMAALGSVPWVGSLISAAAALHGEREQDQASELQRLWLQEHEAKLTRLAATFREMLARFESLGGDIQERVQSEEYLNLIRKGFRSWDSADTDEKRDLVRKLLTNAGATKLCPDDLVRLFIAWIDQYHESHFAVMREVFKNPGATRGQIWANIKGARPREDSSEADLFRLLIRDLTTGGVIRQERETNAHGQFVKKQPQRSASRPTSTVMKSAFDDEEGYVLTELGKEFVHYTMNEVVTRLD